jgi:hypothetical protein
VRYDEAEEIGKTEKNAKNEGMDEKWTRLPFTGCTAEGGGSAGSTVHCDHSAP